MDEICPYPLYCSFCGKSQEDIEVMVAGPTVFICNECVDVCVEQISRTRIRLKLKDSFAQPDHILGLA